MPMQSQGRGRSGLPKNSGVSPDKRKGGAGVDKGGTNGTGAGRGSTTGDNFSIISNTLKERLKEVGHPLRGPIMLQMTFHYIYFPLVLMVANQVNWAPFIRFYTGFLYVTLAVFVLQVSRVIYARSPNSVSPFYLSLIPFILVIIISREIHMVVMVLWYVSFLVIYLQSGHEDLQKHLLIYSVTMMALYGLSVLLMSRYYSRCFDWYCGGVEIDSNEPINRWNELILVVACIAVISAFVMMERFIKSNAWTLLERENYMNQLYLANVDLRKQLRRARNDEEIDLEAPLSKATQILKEIKDTQDVDVSLAEEIEFIIGILSSDQLFNPDIYQKPADADVHDWLNDMLLPAARTPETKGTRASSMRSNPSFTISAVNDVPQAPHPAVTHQREVSFSPDVDHVISSSDAKVFALMEDIENPNFDIFEIDRASNGRVLFYLGWYVFRYHDIFVRYNMSESRFKHWLTKIEQGYKPTNPYHNALHAADVTHSMHYYVTRKRLWGYLSGEEQLASLIAPIIHDYMHPGVNNAFLISTLNPLTIRYNDQSVLENFHCASIFEMIQNEEYDIFTGFTAEARKLVRESIVSMVLATDMAMHFDWIGKFKNKLTGNGFNFENRQDRKLILNIAIKCADVNNPTKPNESCRIWTDLICEEFFRQGDEEKRLGLPISMFMNRETTDIPKCQIGFIDFIVHPLFEAWSGFMMEDLKCQMENIAQNRTYWKTRSERQANQSVNGSQVIITTASEGEQGGNNNSTTPQPTLPPPPPPPASAAPNA
ncbi:High affinity cAMP-specific 3',5'-cyclic phosphodiesterase 7A [Phlyctochytrium planicorne]|nr:High affinity cAMP-specific 3',5'-cyclic phosphodiesterase 7A [Phlyctochytrium planicorne]